MFELPDGRIKMTEIEVLNYRDFMGDVPIPKTKLEFVETVQAAADAMRARVLAGNPRRGDTLIMAEVFEDYIASPHAAETDARMRAWADAGYPMGEDDMRKAGLTSPALDRLQRKRETVKPHDDRALPVEPGLIFPLTRMRQ